MGRRRGRGAHVESRPLAGAAVVVVVVVRGGLVAEAAALDVLGEVVGGIVGQV